MAYLNRITSPKDLKKIKIKNLPLLSSELREFLIKSVSKTGGHLASNLGVVELTIALNYVFDFSTDKIVWDVGHQCYIHKILTGRSGQFNTIRKLDGISGFPKTEESNYDAFNTGHSSTSISAGLGFAIGRDLKNEDYKVVSVIGDGSMTGGLAYEGLNNAGRLNTNFIVVLNDNQMSISENVGGLSKHLNDIRLAPSYLDAKKNVSKFLDTVPLVGDKISKFIERTKDGVRYIFVDGSSMFEELGFTYIGPVDGHDIAELIKIFNRAKEINGPVLLHLITSKGKGYEIAEKNPADFHGVDSFNIETGKPLNEKKNNSYTNIFSSTIVNEAKTNDKIVAITAAMPEGTGLNKFKEEFPDRFFDVGIAESHAVTFAAALAKDGYIPVFAVYSTFLQRSYDQILHDVCIQNLHVIFSIDRAGIVGADGETHQGIYDLSYLSTIPNMTVLAPRSKKEFEHMFRFCLELKSPVAIRYPRDSASELFDDVDINISLGEHELIKEGNEIAIISVGSMIDTAYRLYDELSTNYSVSLINARFIKPISKGIYEAVSNSKYIFTIEDNSIMAGYYSNFVSNSEIALKVHPFAFPDTFVTHGTRKEIFQKYGLDFDSIYCKIKSIIEE